MMLNADSVAAQLEVVKKDIPIAFERDNTFFSMVEKRTDAEDVSSRGLFAPNQVRPGGRARQFNSDGGDIGRGSASQYVRTSATPIDLAFVIELSKKTEISTNMTKKSVANIVNRETASAMSQFRTFLDILSQGNGSGILGTAGTVAGNLITVTGSQGVAWFYVGQGVEFYTSTLATKRAGTAVITMIDYDNSQITLDAAPAGASNGDVIVIEGLAEGGGLTQSLYGVAYQVNSAATGIRQGINVANYPEFRSVEVAKATTDLAFDDLRILLNKMAMRMGVDFAKGSKLKWWGHLQQKHQFEKLAQQIQIATNDSASTSKSADIGYWDVPAMIGVKAEWGIHADPTRLNAIDFSTWCRAVSEQVGYYSPTGSGQTRWPIYGLSGGLAAATWWAIWTSFQFLVNNPRANGYISALKLPTGYT